MRRTLSLAALFVAAFAFTACSDDDSGSNNQGNNNNIQVDASVQHDSMAEIDAAAADAAPEADADTTPWNCAQIGDCAGQCSGNLTCISECKAKGCSTAQTTFTALLTCVTQNCPSECGANGNQNDCDTCMNAKCGTEMQDCGANTCE